MRQCRCCDYILIVTVVIALPITLVMTEGATPYLHAYGQAQDTVTANASRNLVIDGVECMKAEQLAFHIHTKFNLTIDNKSYPIPAGIGIIPINCIFWLHTHDDSGIIHIESPVNRSFTLGQFLNIWNRFNSSDAVIQNLSNNSLNDTVAVYINGTEMTNSTDYRNIELKDQETISLLVSSSR